MPEHADASKSYLKSRCEKDFTAFRAETVFLQMVAGFIPLLPFPAYCPVVCPLARLQNALPGAV